MPTRVDQQDNNGSVVNNAEAIYNFGAGGDGHVASDKEVLAPTLIDRGIQINPLIERLEDMEPEGGVLLVVVPADRADYPDAFVVRCGMVDFVKAFGGIGKWRYLHRRTWPEGATSVRRLLFDIGNSLGGLPASPKQADVEGVVAGLDRHLCFAHFVDGPTWEGDDGALVKQWVDYLADPGKLRAKAGSLVVIFLCLVVTEQRTRGCRKIDAYLEELRQKFPDNAGRVFVTKPLGLIRQQHVEDWRGKAAEYMEIPVIEADLLAVAKGLFTADKTEHRLENLWSPLCDAVKNAVKRAVKFGKGDNK